MKYSNLLFCKLFPFLPKGFPRFFGGIKSTKLLNLSLLAVRSAFQLVYFIICISSTSQKLSLRRYISLPRVYVVVNKASEGGPPPTFFRRITADPCLNLPEFHFILEIIIHQIFSLARDWPKCVTWPNIPQLRPGSDAVLHMSRIEFEFRSTQINLDRLNWFRRRS